MIVICPFSKPAMKARTLANLERQAVQPDAVVIVENGPGIGAFTGKEREGLIILRSRPHQSHAKNKAVQFVRSYGGGWITVFDCDDYYGPGYIAEATDKRQRGAIAGKLDVYTLDDEGLFLPQYEGAAAPYQCPYLMGATMTMHTGDLPAEPFAIVSPGEDTQLCVDFIRQGGQIVNLPPEGFCYIRTGTDRTWVTDVRAKQRRAKATIHVLSDSLDERIVNEGKRRRAA